MLFSGHGGVSVGSVPPQTRGARNRLGSVECSLTFPKNELKLNWVRSAFRESSGGGNLSSHRPRHNWVRSVRSCSTDRAFCNLDLHGGYEPELAPFRQTPCEIPKTRCFALHRHDWVFGQKRPNSIWVCFATVPTPAARPVLRHESQSSRVPFSKRRGQWI